MKNKCTRVRKNVKNDVRMLSIDVENAPVQESGNHKGGRCKGIRCDFDLGPKYGQTSNGHNSSQLALGKKVVLTICCVRRN